MNTRGEQLEILLLVIKNYLYKLEVECCAILDWAGICKNERGYLSINPGFLIEYNKGHKNT